jgi:hypothetical protein
MNDSTMGKRYFRYTANKDNIKQLTSETVDAWLISIGVNPDCVPDCYGSTYRDMLLNKIK